MKAYLFRFSVLFVVLVLVFSGGEIAQGSQNSAPPNQTGLVTRSDLEMLTADWPYPRQNLANTAASTGVSWQLLEQSMEMWQITAPEGYHFGSFFPVAGDLDNDDRVEYLIGARDSDTDDYWLYAINIEDGSYLWELNPESAVYWSAPVIADVNNDAQLDIVLGTRTYTGGSIEVKALNGNDATTIWSRPFDTSGLGMTVADVNGDGWVEVIINDSDDPRMIHLLNGQDGTTIWQRETGGSVYNLPTVGDINGDGITEILSHNRLGDPTRAQLRVWHPDGSPLWDYISAPSAAQQANAPPELGWVPDNGDISTTIADFDADGAVEIGWGTRCHYYMMDGAGEVQWQLPTIDGFGITIIHRPDGSEFPGYAPGGPAGYASGTGNLDDDPAQEIVLSFGPEYRADYYQVDGSLVYADVVPANQVWAIDGATGDVQWVFEGQYPSEDDTEQMYEPILVDLTGDVLALSSDSHLYAIHGATGELLMTYPVNLPKLWIEKHLTFVEDGLKGILLYGSLEEAGNSSLSVLHALRIARPADTPMLDGVWPESAVIPPAGEQIVIDGSNFTAGISIYLGNHELSDITYVSDQQLVARVPATVYPSTYDLKVVSADGDSAILLKAFTVLGNSPPYGAIVDPQNGLNDTPVTIHIHGANFSPGTSASLSNGGAEIPIEGLLFIDSTQLRGTVPLGTPPGSYDLVLSDTRGERTQLGAYTSLDPETSDDLFVIDEFDLWTDPPSIQSGEVFTIGLTIRRQGGKDELINVDADFFMSQIGGLIGRGTAPLIIPNGTANVTTTEIIGRIMSYNIRAVIDPDDEVVEDPANNSIGRHVRVLPNHLIPPTIESFAINDGISDTDSRQVFLNVSASSSTSWSTTPSHLLFVEYKYIQSLHDWVPVARSGWLPYEEAHVDYPWKLEPAAGVHYLQVWAADYSVLISPQPLQAAINYLPSEAYVSRDQIHIYHHTLNSGDTLEARLTTLNGNADLYAWDPDGVFIEPTDDSLPVEDVQITASKSGIYQLEVEGTDSSEYMLEINLSTSGLAETSSSGVMHPNGRERQSPLAETVPDEKIGLPSSPGLQIFLPMLTR